MGHHHDHSKSDNKNLWISFSLNFGFTIFELIGGLYSNSYSITADAIHDLGDGFVILMAIVINKIGSKPPSENYPFGYGKLKVIAAIITSVILFIGSSFILVGALKRFMNPEIVNSTIMIYLAIIGIIINSFALFNMSKSNTKLNRSIMLHMLEDVLGWLAVLLGAIIIKFTGLYIIDSLLSIMISIFIIYNASLNIFDCLKSLILSSPKNIKNEIADIIKKKYELDLDSLKILEIDDNKFYVLFDCSDINNLNIDNKLSEIGVIKVYYNLLKYCKN